MKASAKRQDDNRMNANDRNIGDGPVSRYLRVLLPGFDILLLGFCLFRQSIECYYVIFIFAPVIRTVTFGCQDSSGQPVAWWFIYKYPQSLDYMYIQAGGKPAVCSLLQRIT